MSPATVSIEELAREVMALKQRMAALEQQVGITAAAQPAETPSLAPVLPRTSMADTFPVIGKALLGMAGAYLLRALTEMGVMPHTLGVAAGFLYAAAWLYVAVRTPVEHKFAAVMKSLVSAVILGPLLYEASQRFHAITGWTAASVIVAFALLAVGLCWNRTGSAVPVIVTAGSAVSALALMIALRDLLPFAAALLVIAAAVEFAACFDRETSSRPFLALAADLALVIVAYVAGRPGGVPEGYVRVAPGAIIAAQIALMVIYVASTAARTLAQRRVFTNFETLQTALAFAIGLGGALQIARTIGTGVWEIGVFALLGSAACYFVSFVFMGAGERNRNFYTYSTFAVLLALAGSGLLLSGAGLLAAWSAFASICCWVGMRAGRHVLELHAAMAMICGWFGSGAVMLPQKQLFGDSPAGAPVLAAVLCAGAAVFCYVAVARASRTRESSWDDRLAAIVFAAMFTWTLTGLLTRGLSGLAAELGSTWGTVVLTLLSALLAAFAVLWNLPELRWVAYCLMVVAAYKLIAVDFYHKHTLALVVSLLLYGGTLMLLPQFVAKNKRA